MLHGPAAARAVDRVLEGRPLAYHALRRWGGGPLPPAAAGRARRPLGPVPEPDGLPVERSTGMVGSLAAVGNSMGPRPAASDLKSPELTTSVDHLRGKYFSKQRWKGSAGSSSTRMAPDQRKTSRRASWAVLRAMRRSRPWWRRAGAGSGASGGWPACGRRRNSCDGLRGADNKIMCAFNSCDLSSYN